VPYITIASKKHREVAISREIFNLLDIGTYNNILFKKNLIILRNNKKDVVYGIFI